MRKNKNPIFNLPGKNLRFDIPLHARVGTEFLMLLMALMTFLCILAGCINISLNKMADSWTAGLADTVTIEIPASQSEDEKLGRVVESLARIENVSEARLLDEQELQDLVEPWLGKESGAIADLPVPTLINVKLKERSADVIKNIRATTEDAFPDAQVDAHDDWLGDILKLAGGLQIAGTALIIIIGVVTALTVSGAVRSRMAIHHAELELLHIMGASDRYITRQFQKYILTLSGKGIALGLLLAVITIGTAHSLAANLPETLPRFELYWHHFLVLPAIAALLLLISVFAARRTVMTVLKDMP